MDKSQIATEMQQLFSDSFMPTYSALNSRAALSACTSHFAIWFDRISTPTHYDLRIRKFTYSKLIRVNNRLWYPQSYRKNSNVLPSNLMQMQNGWLRFIHGVTANVQHTHGRSRDDFFKFSILTHCAPSNLRSRQLRHIWLKEDSF